MAFQSMEWLFMKIFLEVFTKRLLGKYFLFEVFVHHIFLGWWGGRIKTCRKDEGTRLHPEMLESIKGTNQIHKAQCKISRRPKMHF